MAIVPAVLYLVLCVALVGLGGVLVVTGRPFPPGIPSNLPEGLPLRFYGLFWLVAGTGLAWLVLRNGASWDGVVIGYFFFGIAVWTMVRGWRKERASDR